MYEETMKFIHTSKSPGDKKGSGSTYNVGRNADKRMRVTYKGPAKTPKGTNQ